MDTITIIISAIIAVLSILLVILLVVLVRQFQKDRDARKELQAHPSGATQTFTPAPRVAHTPTPTSDPTMQAVRQALESQDPGADASAAARAQEAQRPALRPDDRTPPAGNPQVEISNLLNDKEAAANWATESLRGTDSPGRSSSATTAPTPTVPEAAAPPAAAPPKKRTVAMARPFFDEPTNSGPTAPAAPRGVAPSEQEEEDILSMLSPSASAPKPAPPAPAQRTHAPTTRPNPALPRPPGARPPTPAAPRADSPARSAMTAALNRPLTTQIPKISDPFGLPAEESEPNTIKFRDTSLPVAQRLEAFQNLLKASETEERALLIVEAMNDDELEIQLVALQEVNARTSSALLDEVIPLIDASSPAVAIGAIKALESIGGPVVEQSLLAALDNTHDKVRAEAQRVLVSSANPALEEQLSDMLGEDNPRHIESAAEILAGIGGDAIGELLSTRASMLSANPTLQAKLQELSQKARSHSRSGVFPGLSGAEEFEFPHSDLDEFSLSLDPELFNPKNQG